MSLRDVFIFNVCGQDVVKQDVCACNISVDVMAADKMSAYEMYRDVKSSKMCTQDLLRRDVCKRNDMLPANRVNKKYVNYSNWDISMKKRLVMNKLLPAISCIW